MSVVAYFIRAKAKMEVVRMNSTWAVHRPLQLPVNVDLHSERLPILPLFARELVVIVDRQLGCRTYQHAVSG